MIKYRDWDLLDSLPDGWKIDKTSGSPLAGYDFCTNGESLLSGRQNRALVMCAKSDKQSEIVFKALLPTTPKKDAPRQIIDDNYRKTLNTLAREKFKEKLLLDIRTDLMVCELEGWDRLEYIDDLCTLIKGLVK